MPVGSQRARPGEEAKTVEERLVEPLLFLESGHVIDVREIALVGQVEQFGRLGFRFDVVLKSGHVVELGNTEKDRDAQVGAWRQLLLEAWMRAVA